MQWTALGEMKQCWRVECLAFDLRVERSAFRHNLKEVVQTSRKKLLFNQLLGPSFQRLENVLARPSLGHVYCIFPWMVSWEVLGEVFLTPRRPETKFEGAYENRAKAQ